MKELNFTKVFSISFLKVILAIVAICGTYCVLGLLGIVFAIPLFFNIEKLNESISSVEKKSIFGLDFLLSFLLTLTYYPKINCSSELVNILLAILIFVGMSIFLYTPIRLLIGIAAKKGNSISTIKNYNRNKVFFISFIAILIPWFIVFLSKYPGIITYDSSWQLSQVAGNSVLSNHHPLASTMLIDTIYSITYSITGNPIMSVAAYTVFQMIIMDLILSYSVVIISQRFQNKIILLLIVLFFGIHPINSYYSVTMWKDILFGGLVLLLSLVCMQLVDLKDKADVSKKQYFVLITLFLFSSLGVCLFRSNGIVAFAIFVVFLFFEFRKKLKSIFVVGLICLIISVLTVGPFYSYLGVVPSDSIESLSVPIQQISYVVSEDKELSDEQYETLSKIYDVEKAKKTYYSYMSDPIKELVRASNGEDYISKNKGKFIKLWIELGISNPKEYVVATINQVEGFLVPSLINNLTNWIVSDGVCENNIGIECSPILPDKINSVIEYLGHNLFNDGILCSISNCGVIVWLFFISFAICIARRKSKYNLVFYMSLFVYLTLLVATPVSGEFRYIYCMFLSLPLYLTIPFFKQDDIDNKEEYICEDDKELATQSNELK